MNDYTTTVPKNVYALFLQVKMESSKYHTMMAANPLIWKIAKRGIHTNRNVKLTLLSFQERFLNFSENMGISEINSQENKQTKATR